MPAVAGQQINAKEIAPGRIIGFLGKPLGTRTTIDGVLADGVMLANGLAISGIDGHAIDNDSRYMEVRGMRLEKGVRYRLEGYESGEFAGLPGWSNPGAQQPFQYHSFFVVTKVERG